MKSNKIMISAIFTILMAGVGSGAYADCPKVNGYQLNNVALQTNGFTPNPITIGPNVTCAYLNASGDGHKVSMTIPILQVNLDSSWEFWSTSPWPTYICWTTQTGSPTCAFPVK